MLPPTAMHETLEITQGLSNWSGLYVFSSIQPNGEWQWVGVHSSGSAFRKLALARWRKPVNEIGYQRTAFSPDTWTWEIRPIVDKRLDLVFCGQSSTEARFTLALTRRRLLSGRQIQLTTKKIAGGLEYYASYGSLGNRSSS